MDESSRALGSSTTTPSPSYSISVLDYPYCVVHELPELTAESLVSCSLLGQALGRGITGVGRLQGSSTQPGTLGIPVLGCSGIGVVHGAGRCLLPA